MKEIIPMPQDKLWVMLVDDDRQLLLLGQELLEYFGYRVVSAQNAAEALQAFTDYNHQIDLVILDYCLPGLPGLALVAKIRQLAPQVKIIIASGFLTPEENQVLLQNGVDAVINKPFRAGELQDIIQRVLIGVKT